MASSPVPVLFRVFFVLCPCIPLFSQQVAPGTGQRLKGVVTDAASLRPLAGAKVMVILGPEVKASAITDANGLYSLDNIPTGRFSVQCFARGYEPYASPYLIVTSAREVEWNISMGDALEGTGTPQEDTVYQRVIPQVTITALQGSRPVNEFSLVSARSFTAEQVQRYPSSYNDPGRMAMSFAGVMPLKDDNADILIRGNAPMGISWRLEGVDVFAPNHFAQPGSNGGGINTISLGLIGTSDFVTGAFAPEYGNATAGVMDMHLREGNREKREHTVRVGVVGIEAGTEGPIRKDRSSYLINYRYSTLSLLDYAGIHVTGERDRTFFQDLSFKITSAAGKGTVSLFGIGGTSKLLTIPLDSSLWATRSDGNQQSSSRSLTGTTGLTYTRRTGERGTLYAVLAATGNQILDNNDTLTQELKAHTVQTENLAVGRLVAHANYLHKANARLTLKTGIYLTRVFYRFDRRTLDEQTGVSDTLFWKPADQTTLLQGYVQAKVRLTKNLAITGGVHALWFALNTSRSLEPRLAAEYRLGKYQSLALAWGVHSQVLPMGDYFYSARQAGVPGFSYPNQNLPLFRAVHTVLSYQVAWGQYHLVLEAYQQQISQVPVGITLHSTGSLINRRWGYANEQLSPTGTGLNRGLDLTAERFFGRGYFFLIGASAYNATYTTVDGDTFSNNFNGNFSLKAMGGAEISLSTRHTLECGLKGFLAGGQRYTPYAKNDFGGYSQFYENYNKQRLPLYRRLDIRLAWRADLPGYAFTLAFDVQNVLYTANASSVDGVDQSTGAPVFGYSQSLVPLLSWIVDF